MEILKTIYIAPEFKNFILVALFSLVIGLSQRKLHYGHEERKVFGTDRTFALIGILGFVLYYINPISLIPFMIGLIAVIVFLALYYHYKMNTLGATGLTSILIALITYNLTPFIILSPIWLTIFLLVTVLILTEVKETLIEISQKFQKDEFISLAKFLVIAGVVLPVLPNESIVPYLKLTPSKIWLAVVVISSISYVSYLLKKFVFPTAGITLSGILGGLYSSTATTFVMSKKSKDKPELASQYAGAILIATSMMYLRILVLVYIFNPLLARVMFLPMIILFIIALLTGLFFSLKVKLSSEVPDSEEAVDKNPLEIKVALLFTAMFIIFSLITHFTLKEFGSSGLHTLSFIVGITDIDPFLINLFQGNYPSISLTILAAASLQAMLSNNIFKAFATGWLSNYRVRNFCFRGFAIISLANLIMILFLWFMV